MRVVYNLTENTIINTSDEFCRALFAIEEFAQFGNYHSLFLVADIVIGHPENLLGEPAIGIGRNLAVIREDAVHGSHSRGACIVEPRDLNRGRLARENRQPVSDRVSGEIKENVHANLQGTERVR